MEIGAILYVPTRQAWRDWLEVNHDKADDIWLVSYKKRVGKPGLPYNDAVEEALCFGWIDSIRKGYGEDRTAQRFTPRRAGSAISQTNMERLARMIEQGKVIPPVRATLGEVTPEAYKIPEDILSALQANAQAWRFFQMTSPAYQRIRAAYVDHARDQTEVFTKRLRHLVRMSAQEKQFGYGIESYY